MKRSVFYGWYVVVVTALVLIVTAGSRAAPGALLEPMKDDTGWSTTQLSISASLGLLAYGIGGPFAGAVLRRFGIKAVTLASLLSTSAAMACASRANSIMAVTLWFGVVSGLAAGLVASVLGAAVANRWFVERRGVVTGIFGAAQSAGLLVFIPLLAFIADASSWRSAVLLTSVLAALLVPIVVGIVRESPSDVGAAPLGATSMETVVRPDRDIVRRALRRPEFWLLATTFMVCGGTSNGLVGQHFISHAVDHGFSETQAASWLGVMGVFNFVGTVGSGVLTDRFDPRRLLMVYYGFRGVSLLLLPLVHDNLSIGAFAILFGLDYIATVPPTIMLCANLFGRHNAGTVYGLVFAAHQFGAAVAAVGAGAVRDATGSYAYAFGTAGAIAIAAGFCALMIKDKSEGVAATAGV